MSVHFKKSREKEIEATYENYMIMFEGINACFTVMYTLVSISGNICLEHDDIILHTLQEDGESRK